MHGLNMMIEKPTPPIFDDTGDGIGAYKKQDQIKALVLDKRNEKLTIRERAQYCTKSGDPYDIYLHALALIKTKNDSDEEIVTSSSCLTLFCKELKEVGVDYKDLANVIMMLSMRPAEDMLRIREKKVNPEPQQSLSMEENPECARELLTWIQDAIATEKLCVPVYGDNRKHNIRAFSKFLKAYVHGSRNPTAQHLSLPCRIAMRQKIDHFDSGTYYAEGKVEIGGWNLLDVFIWISDKTFSDNALTSVYDLK
nr:8241_t:CDS:2 [Entrophospora candida]